MADDDRTIDADETPQPLIDGRYRVISLLGRGGFGEVQLVEDTLRRNKRLALKSILPQHSATAEFEKRFHREIDVLRSLQNDHIPQIVNDGRTADGIFYFTMDFVEGVPLGKLVKADGPLAPARLASITSQLARVLDYAHGKGVVHRDLKPGNIIVSNAGTQEERVHVLDFGIAKLLSTPDGEPGITLETAGFIGTPEFASPEQVLGDDVDARSDIYALGILIYFLATGKFPFEGKSRQEVATKRLHTPPTPLTPKEAPKEIRSIVRSMLERDRKQRPELRVIADALERVLGELGSERREHTKSLRFVAVAGALAAGIAVLALALGGRGSDDEQEQGNPRKPTDDVVAKGEGAKTSGAEGSTPNALEGSPGTSGPGGEDAAATAENKGVNAHVEEGAPADVDPEPSTSSEAQGAKEGAGEGTGGDTGEATGDVAATDTAKDGEPTGNGSVPPPIGESTTPAVPEETVDRVPPEFVLSAPGEVSFTTTERTVEVRGRVTDDAVVTLSLKGQVIPLDEGGGFSTVLTLVKVGLNRFDLIARDETGNETVRTLTVERALIPLSLSFKEFKDGLEVGPGTPTLVLEGRVVGWSADRELEVQVTGRQVAIDEGAFRVDVALSTGSNRVEVVVLEDGNSERARETAFVTRRPPKLPRGARLVPGTEFVGDVPRRVTLGDPAIPFVLVEASAAPGGAAYYIGETEISRTQFAQRPGHPVTDGNLPQVEVSAADAEAFAASLGAALPSAARWRSAAWGATSGQAYPWGSEADSDRCNAREAGRGAPVVVDDSAFARGRSTALGLWHVSGNVAEWTLDENGDPVALGGSFRSKLDRCRIDLPAGSTGLINARPEIGLRLSLALAPE